MKTHAEGRSKVARNQDPQLIWQAADESKLLEPPEVFYVTTGDGVRIALHHYPAAARTPRRSPILYMHGLGANRHNFEMFGDPKALPRQLAARGHEGYVVELRGVGMSEKAHSVKRVDEYLQYDLPAAVDFILKRDGVTSLHWIGHSLGSILGYVYGSRHPGQLQSFVTAAGPLPGSVSFIGRDWVLPLRHIRALHGLTLPGRRGAAGVVKHVPRLARFATHGILLNASNMTDDLLRKVAEHCLEDVPFAVLSRLAEWVTRHGPHAGEVERALSRLDVPTLFLGGTMDPWCPVKAIESAAQWMPPGRATVKVVSKKTGFHVDFGHGDILVSQAAEQYVYPEIIRFVAEHDFDARLPRHSA